jgi:hypothetical protein
MHLELDDDFLDEIVCQSLVDTYVGLMRDLERVDKGQIDRAEEDVMLWKRVAYAIEILGEWYFSDFEAAVKKREKIK